MITDFKMRGDILGLDAISTRRHSCTAIALEDSEVSSIHFLGLEKIARDIPLLQHNLSKLLSSEIMHNRRTLFMMNYMQADRRFACFLYDLSQRHSTQGYPPEHFTLKMRREEIASYLGLRLETICRCITRISNQRVVAISGRNVHILDMAALKSLTDANDQS